MTRMVINERTLSPTFVDDVPALEVCDWEPSCLTHGDVCEIDQQDCVRRAKGAHPVCGRPQEEEEQ